MGVYRHEFECMKTAVELPQWLDNLIFEQLGAKYCRSNSDMTVIDWNKSNVLNYLGTYFPRSYAESYCIFSEFFQSQPETFVDKEVLTVFDFGCGTGGEIIGLLNAISENLRNVKRVNLVAMDGNYHALRLFESILIEYSNRMNLKVKSRIVPLTIDDFYDLTMLDRILEEKFDVFMSFKAICEFVSKERFEEKNAYAHIMNTFIPKIATNGVMLFVDVSTYNNVSQEWLPKMMDAGIAQAGCKSFSRNEGFNQEFLVIHSRKQNDISKVAWRILKR